MRKRERGRELDMPETDGVALAGDATHGGDLVALRERARRFRAAVALWTT